MNAKLYHDNFRKIKFALKGPKGHFYVKKNVLIFSKIAIKYIFGKTF